MTPRQKLFALAESMGVDVDYGRGYIHPRTHQISPYCITLDAPTGHIFAATGLHCDCGIGGKEGELKTDWTDALRQVESVLSGGVVKCVDPDCEYCEDNPL